MPNDSREFYAAPIDDLSQGDIVEISPHLYLDPPIRRIVPLAEGGINTLETTLSTGMSAAEVVAHCSPQRALIFNYDCEIAKPEMLRLLVCPVIGLSTFPPANHGNVKRNRTAHLFFLPRFQDKLDDSVAVLNQVTTVNRALLSQLTRIVSLAPIGRLAMYAQFIRWLTRWQLRELSCPNCRVEFDPTLSLPVRSAGDK
jgi:hypothetical protein